MQLLEQNKNNPILSLIIPVYNVENYLVSCLDSIISQNTDEIEIILVDDGSTDNSLQILNTYSTKWKNVFVVHQVNQGVSAARNVGLKKSTGEYVWFIDSDDEVMHNSINKIINDIKSYKTDLIEYAFFFGSNKRQYHKHKNLYYSKYSIIGQFIERPKFTLWNKIIKRKCIQHLFTIGLRMGEDYIFLTHVYDNIQSLLYNPAAIYKYRDVREGSAMNCIRGNHELKLIKIVKYETYTTPIFNDLMPIVFLNRSLLRRRNSEIYGLLRTSVHNVPFRKFLVLGLSLEKLIVTLLVRVI